MTSARLSDDAHVRNRMFPKTRSWFALGGPVELLSPLSVARTVFALAAVLWAVAFVDFHRSVSEVVILAVAVSVVAGTWCALLAVRDLTPQACRGLATGLGVLVLVLIHAGDTPTATVMFAAILLPLSVFVALYLGLRRSLEFLGMVSLGVGLALIGRLPGPAPVAVAVVSGLGLATVVLTVSLLARSVWRGGLSTPTPVCPMPSVSPSACPPPPTARSPGTSPASSPR